MTGRAAPATRGGSWTMTPGLGVQRRVASAKSLFSRFSLTPNGLFAIILCLPAAGAGDGCCARLLSLTQPATDAARRQGRPDAVYDAVHCRPTSHALRRA